MPATLSPREAVILQIWRLTFGTTFGLVTSAAEKSAVDLKSSALGGSVEPSGSR